VDLENWTLTVSGTVQKPDGSRGLLPFAFLGDNAPDPFKAEWNGNTEGQSNMVHHKFVVTDFNGARPTVFTGSSNMAQGGEEDNGDHMIQIEDRKIAISYAVEALRLFDHFHFRVNAQSPGALTELRLARPPAPGKSPGLRPTSNRARQGARQEPLHQLSGPGGSAAVNTPCLFRPPTRRQWHIDSSDTRPAPCYRRHSRRNPGLRGPPCFAILRDRNGRSLPWSGANSWFRATPRIARRISSRTQALLTPSTPVVVEWKRFAGLRSTRAPTQRLPRGCSTGS
jgi:hypothetical protein